ncbi:putative xanthine dehydrogenase protein [Botrytis fragariae]|uniref:Putative xanthine dehydrogenase protein n=1 Tax=Botrytis fragariae TaxID=1964551 RepID=A0A8H6EI84_9HELO|nr:putative xanthine dehydrogenase protein [Botrytis fragariae]KAF5872835.1 putative xanthine dehydrogenase protein [Botrytis fragariae]
MIPKSRSKFHSTLEPNDAVDKSSEKRKAERNQREKLNARNAIAEKARQEIEEREMLGSASQDTKIPLSVGSGKTQKSLASGCFDGNSSIDCVVESSTLAQEKTEVYFSNAMFEIKASPGKGLGAFATQDIKKETKVLREAPVMNCGTHWLLKEVFFMSPNEEKKKFLRSLHSHCICSEKPCRETTLMKIYDLNSFDIVNDKPERTNYIYHFSSRINHECLPSMARRDTKNGDLVSSATMKYAPWIIANESGSEILNKPTMEEMQTAKLVESWFESVSKVAEKAGQGMAIAIGNDLLRSQSTQERRHLIVENTMQIFDAYLRKNNPYGLSDEIISAYRYRANTSTFGAASQVFNNMERKMGISPEEF